MLVPHRNQGSAKMSHRIRIVAVHLIAGASLAGCGGAARPASPAAPAADARMAAVEQARADSVRRPYTEADIEFMTGMIRHHAQAIRMARLAPTHGASRSVRTLAARIINSQRDEITAMQQWLRDRLQPVPEVSEDGTVAIPAGAHGAHAMHGGEMAGMLTAEQLDELEEARGREFDRLFLSYMIQHHQGAVAMVQELFGTYGAGQDETVFKLASDINVDQITEIERMKRMLVEVILSPT
jgi:uncharacterized protein (DUF305 family)